MSEKTTGTCAACGASDPREPWYAACGSFSEWAINNWPAPNTDLYTNDDLKIWEIALCTPCSIVGYQTSRKKQIRNRLIALVVSIVLICVFSYLLITGNGDSRNSSDAMAIAIAALAAGIGILVSAVLLLISILQLKRSKTLDTISDDVMRAGIETFAKGLIKELAGDASEEKKARFPLPRHLEKSELKIPEDLRRKLNADKYGTQKRRIDGVDRNRDLLLMRLSVHWGDLVPKKPKADAKPGSILGQIQQ